MSLESIPSRFAARFLSAKSACQLTSASCGILATCWIQQAQTGFGTSLISQTALVLVVLLAVGMAGSMSMLLGRFQPVRSSAQRVTLLIILQTMIAATVLFPNFFYGAGWMTIDSLLGGTLPATTLSQLAITTAGLTVSWLVSFGAVTMLLAGSIQNPEASEATESDGSIHVRLAVAAIAAMISMTVLAGTLGLHTVTWIALSTGFVGTAIEIAMILRTERASETSETIDAILSPEAIHGQLSTDVISALQSGTPAFLSVLPVAVLCGILFASLSRISGQLFFAATWQSVVQWSSLVLIAIAAQTLTGKRKATPSHLLLIAGVGSVAILAVWPLLVRLCLEINSGISTVAISGIARAIIAIICVAPAGLALGFITSWQTSQPGNSGSARANTDSGTDTFRFAALLTAFLSGWLANHWWLVGAYSVSNIVIATSFALAIFGIAQLFRSESWRSTLRPTFAVCSFVVLGGPLLVQRYDPVTSAKLLFDTAVFVAHQHEARTDILPHLDEGRCIATAESNHGTLTFWRYRGQQLQLRESGLPVSSISCDTRICTQPSAESMQIILPMIMHEGPSRLLLLGVRSGAVLQTSIAFPLESIVCVESDQRIIDAVTDQVFTRATPNPLEDSRVELQTAEPLLKLRTSSGQADIIIASADQQGIPQAAAMITAEFLKSASKALHDNGLFCQPLDYPDFGPDALQVIVATWQSVFSEVAAIEIAPGKLLLMATNSPAGIIRPGIIERLQRPNVRFALAQTGWDWSTPLRLSIYTDQGLKTAFGDGEQPVSNTSNSRLTCLLPWEVMRWGDKYSAVMKKLGPVGQTLQFTIGEDAYSPEVSNRLVELTEQQELIHEHPDEYWFYRRKVKERLKKTPQAELVQVKGEEPLHELHENEKRRVDYFTTLGRAAKQKTPGLADLQAIEEFATPHDPLISLFLHQELAELATRNRDANFEVELRHRLHRIYFTASSDQAVRNVIASIELLCEHPEAIHDDAERADQLDALLQVLHDRWHNRGDKAPGSSKIVLNDIEQSVAAIDKAFAALEKLSPAREYSPEQWQARRLALEKSLLRPLQAYRTTLMPHHAKSR
ncbi:MAG: hypothetical protein HQ518_13745 [Rhodopirellula sp.]|nr:hypothetical protein [Rhodopirellula sp.]